MHVALVMQMPARQTVVLLLKRVRSVTMIRFIWVAEGSCSGKMIEVQDLLSSDQSRTLRPANECVLGKSRGRDGWEKGAFVWGCFKGGASCGGRLWEAAESDTSRSVVVV